MAPKKGKLKEKKEINVEEVPDFIEVETEFYLLQIADLNRKVARLRSVVEEYEVRNKQLQQAYDKLDVDRADIITYLKKNLKAKSDENNELIERVKYLEKAKELETVKFKKMLEESEKNFVNMKNQLSSQNKLLNSKLNTLDEFKAIKDDLMNKFEKQECKFQSQEMKYKRIIYDTEKKFIIDKDKLKKEMEARLLQLAQDFQDANELRIAASTHRVIRENIAINNELNNVLGYQTKLSESNQKYKESETVARVAMELAEEERDKAINKSVIQLKVIEQLTTAFQKFKKENALYEKKNFDYEALREQIQNLTKENDDLMLQVRILQQNLHAKVSDQNKGVVETTEVAVENRMLRKMLKQVTNVIQASLKIDQWATKDPNRNKVEIEDILIQLLGIVTQYREIQRTESMETLASFGKIYEEGDLGFMPKPIAQRSAMFAALSVPSKESLDLAMNKRSASSFSVSSGPPSSIKTIPSKIILFEKSSQDQELPKEESFLSFATSNKSQITSSTEEEEEELDVVDIQNQLAVSKMDIQKSLMDLAHTLMSSKSLIRCNAPSPRDSMNRIRISASKSVCSLDTSLEDSVSTKSGKEYENFEKQESNTGKDIEKEEIKEVLSESHLNKYAEENKEKENIEENVIEDKEEMEETIILSEKPNEEDS